MNIYLRWAAAFAAATLMLSSCNNKKGGDADADDGGGGSAKTASVKELIQGAWAPDLNSVVAMMSGGAELPEAQKAQMMEMAKLMAGKMVIELRDGNATIHKPGEPEKETYEFVSTDDATGAFVVTMNNADGTAENGEGTVKGDTMTMTSDGVTMKMTRLSDEEFEKRKKEIAETAIPGGGG